jgi:non-homologous end joining protein Ku
MPRSLWNGTISVGLINVPVKLYSAVESKTVHFHEVHLGDGAKVEHRRFCSAEEREVPYEEVVSRARLEDVIARKRKGKRISAPRPEKEPSPAPDLMGALERSLAAAKGETRPSRDGGGDLGSLSRDELYEHAQDRDVPGRSSMTKEQLVKALSR